MIASFGPVVFAVSRKEIRTFSGFTRKGTATFAEHAVLSSKPLLEFVGEGLDEISLRIELSTTHGLVPETEIEQLRKIKKAAEALPLIVGDKVLGNFVLVEIAEEWTAINNKGVLVKAACNLSLREYV